MCKRMQMYYSQSHTVACHSQLQGATHPAPSSSAGWGDKVTKLKVRNVHWSSITSEYHTLELFTLSFWRCKGIGSPASLRRKSWSHLIQAQSLGFPSPHYSSPSCKTVVLCPVSSKEPHPRVVYKPNSYQLQQMKEEMQCLNIDWR